MTRADIAMFPRRSHTLRRISCHPHGRAAKRPIACRARAQLPRLCTWHARNLESPAINLPSTCDSGLRSMTGHQLLAKKLVRRAHARFHARADATRSARRQPARPVTRARADGCHTVPPPSVIAGCHRCRAGSARGHTWGWALTTRATPRTTCAEANVGRRRAERHAREVHELYVGGSLRAIAARLPRRGGRPYALGARSRHRATPGSSREPRRGSERTPEDVRDLSTALDFLECPARKVLGSHALIRSLVAAPDSAYAREANAALP